MARVLPVAVPDKPAERVSALFDAHHDRLYRLARRLAPTVDDALDLVQETFLKVAKAPGAVPAGHTDEEAWLVRVLINIQRDRWRRESVRSRHDRGLRPVDGGSDPETALIARATLWRALDELAPRRRAVLVMHELDGLGIEAIATLLGVSQVTVRWHLSRGRRELARVLGADKGGINETH